MMSKRFSFILFFLLSLNLVHAQNKKLHRLDIKTVADLHAFFAYTPDRIPLVCGHRGGIAAGFPENSIAAMEFTLSKTSAFFEIDPRLTRDSVMVILHDATLDRTTTGKGKLSDYTWAEVKKLKLKDSKGMVTKYGIPTLNEVIKWSKGKTVLMIDKKDVPLPMLLYAITKNKAESNVLISSYAPEEAKYYYEKNNKLMFEAFIKNKEQMKAYEETGVPWKNIVAYLGQPKSKTLYDALHEKGVMCIVYTAPVLEKVKDKEVRIKSYQGLINNGVDILLADEVLEVADAIKQFVPNQSSKQRFFSKNMN